MLYDPTDKPRSRPAATEGVTMTDTSSNVSALLLGPRLRLRLALADAVMVASTHRLRTLPPAGQFEVDFEAILLDSGPAVLEPRPRFAPRVAFATKAMTLVLVEIPISTPAVMDGAIAKEADTSTSVIVLLLPTAMPALPSTPIEGVTAASMQILSAFPPAEHDVDGEEVTVLECCKPSMPGLIPMLALAPISTTPVPIDMPTSALTAAEGAIPRLIDASTIAIVLLPRATLTAPPTPTEGVTTASRQMSRTLSKTEQLIDGDAVALDAVMRLVVVRRDVPSVVAGDMMSVTEGVKMVEVGYDRLAAPLPSVAMGPILLVVASEVVPGSLVVVVLDVFSET